MNDVNLMMNELRDVIEMKKKYEAAEKVLKEQIQGYMEENNENKLENGKVKIAYVGASESVSLDTTKLKKAEADLYRELIEDYPKLTKRSASLRVTVIDDA